MSQENKAFLWDSQMRRLKEGIAKRSVRISLIREISARISQLCMN